MISKAMMKPIMLVKAKRMNKRVHMMRRNWLFLLKMIRVISRLMKIKKPRVYRPVKRVMKAGVTARMI